MTLKSLAQLKAKGVISLTFPTRKLTIKGKTKEKNQLNISKFAKFTLNDNCIIDGNRRMSTIMLLQKSLFQ